MRRSSLWHSLTRPLPAPLTPPWRQVLKDGLGQLGTLAFGKVVNHQFDCHSKTWFFLSAVMLKAATGVEIATALFPTHFLVLGTVANSLKGAQPSPLAATLAVHTLQPKSGGKAGGKVAPWLCARVCRAGVDGEQQHALGLHALLCARQQPGRPHRQVRGAAWGAGARGDPAAHTPGATDPLRGKLLVGVAQESTRNPSLQRHGGAVSLVGARSPSHSASLLPGAVLACCRSTSQWICASILGTALGAWICTAVGQDTRAAAGVFLALTACSLAGAFATVKTVALPTLNTTRLQVKTHARRRRRRSLCFPGRRGMKGAAHALACKALTKATGMEGADAPVRPAPPAAAV